MSNELDNKIENKEKANELLSLRTTKTKKEFIENYKVQNGFKTADELIDKIIKLISSEKIDETEKKFNLDEDMKVITKSIENIKGVLEGITAKVNAEIDDTIIRTNVKIEQKDVVLREAESIIKDMQLNTEKQFEHFKNENNELVKELDDVKKDLVAAEANILYLDEENKVKDIEINQLKIEKNKLDMQVTECLESKKEMQVRINSLLDLEVKNKKLKDILENIKESNRNLETEIAIRNNTINAKEDTIRTLNDNIILLETTIKDRDNVISNAKEEKSQLNITIASLNNKIENLYDSKKVLASDLETVKSFLTAKEQELNTLKEEYRNTVANMTIQCKEKILEAKFEAKDESEKKYENKIEKLKDEVYNLKKELKTFKTNEE